MSPSSESTEERITRLHGEGIVDLHFDLPMFLYDNRDRKNVLASDFLPEFEAGDIGTAAAGIYIEDQYIPDNAFEVALGQVARIYVEVERCDRFTIWRSYAEIYNARKYYDVERNISDEQIKMVGARGGVIGINSVLVSPKKEDSTLDRYVDHVAYVIDLIGIDSVGIGFDFFEFIYRRWSEDERVKFHQKFPNVHFIPDLLHHGHARNLTARLIERGFNDGQIEKILFRNWMRIFEELLG